MWDTCNEKGEGGMSKSHSTVRKRVRCIYSLVRWSAKSSKVQTPCALFIQLRDISLFLDWATSSSKIRLLLKNCFIWFYKSEITLESKLQILSGIFNLEFYSEMFHSFTLRILLYLIWYQSSNLYLQAFWSFSSNVILQING